MTVCQRNPGAHGTSALLLGTLCALAIPASTASAATLHLFAKTTQSTFTDPSGHPILGHVPPPAAGSVLTNTGVEYLGNLRHHARSTSATTNIICFVTKAPMALCYGQIAIGGSMLLANRFTAIGRGVAPSDLPDYPIAYDAGKALHAAGKAKGEYGFGAQWAGQGAPLSRAMPAADLVALLRREMSSA